MNLTVLKMIFNSTDISKTMSQINIANEILQIVIQKIIHRIVLFMMRK